MSAGGNARGRAASIPCAVFFLVIFAGQAHAHHNVGHGPSEGLRVLSASGNNAAPRQRVALLGQVTRSTDEPLLNTATTYSFSALAEIKLHNRIFVDLQAPFILVNEDATEEMKAGYGDTMVGLQFSVGNLKEKNAASWVVSLGAGFPTRTITYESDPGRQWTVTPGVRYADNHEKWLWYSMLLFPFETRPAGTALDANIAAGMGYRLVRPLALTWGANTDIRMLTVCQDLDGSEVCSSGRSSEDNRPMGAVRAYAHAGVTFDLSKNWSLFTGGQLPVTARRDIEWSVSLGAEARF